MRIDHGKYRISIEHGYVLVLVKKNMPMCVSTYTEQVEL